MGKVTGEFLRASKKKGKGGNKGKKSQSILAKKPGGGEVQRNIHDNKSRSSLR